MATSRLPTRRTSSAVISPSPSRPARAPNRASVVARPRVPSTSEPQPSPARQSAEQLIAQIFRYEAECASHAYALGVCLSELSLPKRYRDELGFDSFEALLVKRKLPTRMTAFKLIAVVSTFSEREVDRLGGTEKSYALVRYAKRLASSPDPRRYLDPNARLLGRPVSELSVRDIHRTSAGGGNGRSPSPTETKQAKKIARRLAGALRRGKVPHRMRVHAHPDTCVSVHLDASAAAALADWLVRCQKHEGK
jgi:hypothetical protein